MEGTSRRRQEGGYGNEMIEKLSGNDSQADQAIYRTTSHVRLHARCMSVSSDAVKDAERESGEKTHQIVAQVTQMRPSVSR
eukprot:5154752-Pleurochrysis_carterae.AAC.2